MKEALKIPELPFPRWIKDTSVHGITILMQIKEVNLNTPLKIKLLHSPVDLKITIRSSCTADKNVRMIYCPKEQRESLVRSWSQKHTEKCDSFSSTVTLPTRLFFYILLAVPAAK